MQRIRWAGLSQGQAFHLNRTPYRRGTGFALHDHDFAEIFWIAAGPGRCRHLRPGGEELLSSGDLVVVRPRDAHGFAAERDGFTLVNLAFPQDSLDHIAQRYQVDLATRHLPADSLERLERAVRDLAHGSRTLLALERFLLDLAGLIAPTGPAQVPDGCPPWLATVVQRLAAGELLDVGVSGVARAAGCSRGHFARASTRFLGCTATELLNRHRLDRARNLLAIDDAPIPAIAVSCGLANLSHFYRLFRSSTGCTPRAWRLRARQAG